MIVYCSDFPSCNIDFNVPYCLSFPDHSRNESAGSVDLRLLQANTTTAGSAEIASRPFRVYNNHSRLKLGFHTRMDDWEDDLLALAEAPAPKKKKKDKKKRKRE